MWPKETVTKNFRSGVQAIYTHQKMVQQLAKAKEEAVKIKRVVNFVASLLPETTQGQITPGVNDGFYLMISDWSDCATLIGP